MFRLLLDLTIIRLNGWSIIDRGRLAFRSLLDEIIETRTQYKLLLVTGRSAWRRRAYPVALDLGMPLLAFRPVWVPASASKTHQSFLCC